MPHNSRWNCHKRHGRHIKFSIRGKDENERRKTVLELTGQIRQVAFQLHTYLRYGHLEKVYENGLAHRLRKAGMKVEQ